MAPADLSELIQYQGQVYNADIFEKHQTFKDICQNDGSTLFSAYFFYNSQSNPKYLAAKIKVIDS
ncbi:MAG: hypothetical protein ACO36E_14065 [Synechocystis sp.]